MEAKNTANELVKDLNQRGGMDEFVKRLSISEKDRHILTLYIQLNMYTSQNKGFDTGKRFIQKGLFDLLNIRAELDAYNELEY
jgi:hypothetical protein